MSIRFKIINAYEIIMNFTNNIKIVLLSYIFCVSTMNAGWSASLMGLGQKIKTTLVQHNKIVAGISAILAGIYTFNKYTDYILRRKVTDKIESIKLMVAQNCIPYDISWSVTAWPNKKATVKLTLNPTVGALYTGKPIRAMISTDLPPYGFDEAQIIYQ